MKKNSITRDIKVTQLTAPLIQPFRTALGEHKNLENILFTVKLADGTKGFGEAAVAPHITGETIAKTRSNLKKAAEELKGKDVSDYLQITEELREEFYDNKSALAAVEMALLDAVTKQWGIPLWKLFGTKCERLKTDITIVIAGLEETEDAVKNFYRQGFRKFKVKIGRDKDLDLKRVLAVRKLAPRSDIYLDANQGYSAKQTLAFLKQLKKSRMRLALLEQPVPKNDWEGLEKVNRLAGIPVCADESVSSLADAVRAIRQKAVSVINIKFMKFGILESHTIAQMAKVAGIKLMIGGMMETSLAMTASAHLAAGLGGFDFVDLDTPFFIKEGLKGNPYLSRRGIYDLSNVRKGIGIEINRS